MTAEGSGRAAAGVHRATYTYHRMNEILNEIGPVIHVTVPDEAAENTAADTNNLWSAS